MQPLFPKVVRLLLFATLFISISSGRAAAAARIAAGELSVQMDASGGDYEISSQNPSWTFGGGLAAALKNITTNHGADALGGYQQISFQWQGAQTPMSGWIRIYDGRPVALFSQTCGVASDTPPAPFPAFTKLPGSLHIFSYQRSTFAPPRFDANDTSTPWLLFDDHANAFIISPASHFMVASMMGDGHTEVASGFNSGLRNLPAGFTQQTLVAFGQGVNNTWDRWGHALRQLEHAKRPSNEADTVLKYLGYWTDNGAYYYYNYDLTKGYAGTLEELVNRYRREQIPIHYLQLDSWWYYKTTTNPDGTPGAQKKSEKLPAGEWNRYGGLLEYKAHPDLFPNGLASFQKTIDLPLVTHNRWIDPASPYHQHYQISGVAAVDPKWWKMIADYLKTSGVVTYEQDWLDRIYEYSPAFSTNLDTGEDFLNDMSRACARREITLQYCMPLPCFFLQGSRYDNLTSIRTSDDRFNREKWNNFLYTSRLADSMGIWPWADVYMSRETNNLLLSTLSAGPVGIGDAMGRENKGNLLHAVRADGVIVKPDAPIVPLDQSYLADAQNMNAPLVAGTYTEQGGVRTEYVFAFNRAGTSADQVEFRPAELGLKGPVYVFDYFAGAGKLVDDGASFSAPLDANAAVFYVVAPLGQSGIAFLGDKDKFVGTGKQRITSLTDRPGTLTVGVALAKNEDSVTLHGFADAPPGVTLKGGRETGAQYDPTTHYFTVEIARDRKAVANLFASGRITVILKIPN